jgi:hypothetical protein
VYDCTGSEVKSLKGQNRERERFVEGQEVEQGDDDEHGRRVHVERQGDAPREPVAGDHARRDHHAERDHVHRVSPDGEQREPHEHQHDVDPQPVGHTLHPSHSQTLLSKCPERPVAVEGR